MKNHCLPFIVLFLLYIFFPSSGFCQIQLEEELLSFPEITSVVRLEADSVFDEIYEVYISQPVDHNDPEGAIFNQKFYIGHVDRNLPVVIELDGYSLTFPRYNELSDILNCNKIQVEHRYFGESVPENPEWKYLTVEQSANDHHRIIGLMKNLYRGKWISSGVSKGGQTTIFHRYFFYDDVDVSVPYVAPLNIAQEDPRIYSFLRSVGTEECRENMIDFQREVLKRADDLVPLFKEESDKLGYTYSIGNDRFVFEYVVLEY